MLTVPFLLAALAAICTVMAFRDALAGYVVRLLFPEGSEQQIKLLQYTETAQKEAIAALESRMEVLESNIGDLVVQRTAYQAELSSLRVERATDGERIAQLEKVHEADAATIVQITAERDEFKELVRNQSVTIVGLTARVFELEQFIHPGETHDRPDSVPAQQPA